MDTEAKHGLPKVVALADKLARLVLDQIEKDGCGNLENIRNALVGPLAQDEMDRQDSKARARQQWEVASAPARQAGKSEAWQKFKESLGPLPKGCLAYDPAESNLRQGVYEAKTGQLVVWETRADGHRYAVKPTRALLQAFGDAIARGQPQRVSISDGTYVLPDGEVLTEQEMFVRQGGPNGRQSRS